MSSFWQAPLTCKRVHCRHGHLTPGSYQHWDFCLASDCPCRVPPKAGTILDCQNACCGAKPSCSHRRTGKCFPLSCVCLVCWVHWIIRKTALKRGQSVCRIWGRITIYCDGVVITFAAYVGETDFVVHMVSLLHLFNDKLSATLWASLSDTFPQTLPDLVTPLKGHSLSLHSCPLTWSAPSERSGY